MNTFSPNLVACASEGRRFFYERVGRYFYKPENPASTDTCPRCGAEGVQLEKNGKKIDCVGYRAMTAKRYAPADGAPVAFGSPLKDPHKRGMTTFGDSAYALIEQDRSYVACNLIPVAPLPDSMTAVRTGLRELRAIIRRLLTSPPTEPFLFVAFSRASDYPMILSRPGDNVWLCQAPSPVCLSLSKLAETLAFYEANEALIKPLKNLCYLRADLDAGSPKAAQRINALLKKNPKFAQMLPLLPDPLAPETQLASSLFNETSNKSAKAS
jgi:hypothetical protein